MRIPKKWTFTKVVCHASRLLEKGWKVKQGKNRRIFFKPPGDERFRFCTLEALGRHFVGPKITQGGYSEAARKLHIHSRLKEDVVDANDSPVLGPSLNAPWEDSENRILLLLGLGLPLDCGWRKCVSDKFKRRVEKVLSRKRKKG